MPRALIPLLCLLLAGCPLRKPEAPEPVIVRQYVPVPPKLTERCPWPRERKNSEVFESDAARGKCLKQYEGQFEAIESLKP